MLTVGKKWIIENINPNLKINLYGQELNDTTYAICKSDFDSERIQKILRDQNLHFQKMNLKEKNLITIVNLFR